MLILITLVTLVNECYKMVALWALNLKESNMDKIISGISNGLTSFVISVAEGTILPLLNA